MDNKDHRYRLLTMQHHMHTCTYTKQLSQAIPDASQTGVDYSGAGDMSDSSVDAL